MSEQLVDILHHALVLRYGEKDRSAAEYLVSLCALSQPSVDIIEGAKQALAYTTAKIHCKNGHNYAVKDALCPKCAAEPSVGVDELESVITAAATHHGPLGPVCNLGSRDAWNIRCGILARYNVTPKGE